MRRRGLTLLFAFLVLVAAFGWEDGANARPAQLSVAVAGTPIKHVVVIYQENHSFDETLGALCLTRSSPCNGFVGTVTLKDGTRVAMKPSRDIVPQVAHLVHSQVAAINGGAMDGWADVVGCEAAHSFACLTYQTPAKTPTLARLANAYAVSDRTFSMAQSPSWGGHLYAAAATQDSFLGEGPLDTPGVPAGPGWGCDSKKSTLWRDPATGATSRQPSCIPDYTHINQALHPHGGAFRATPAGTVATIFDRLDAVGQSWKIYGQPDSADPTSRNGYNWSICPTFAKCLYTKQVHNLVPTVAVLTAAARGSLPAYSVVIPSTSSREASGGRSTSQHNGDSMMVGDNWVGRVVSAIQHGPDGPSTAIFITYDDCGCFYDHVRPGVNPDGTGQGPRVPMVIVSPYTKAGFTDSTPATFASILAFTEHTFGLTPLSANDARAYDFSHSFDYTLAPRPPLSLAQHPLPASTVSYLRSHPVEEDDVS